MEQSVIDNYLVSIIEQVIFIGVFLFTYKLIKEKVIEKGTPKWKMVIFTILYSIVSPLFVLGLMQYGILGEFAYEQYNSQENFLKLLVNVIAIVFFNVIYVVFASAAVLKEREKREDKINQEVEIRFQRNKLNDTL